MLHKTHFDLSVVEGFLRSIMEFFPAKAILSIFGLAFAWVFNTDTEILKTVYVLIGIDTFLGIWCAIRLRRLSSIGFYRVAIKCLIYFIMIIVSRLVDKHAPVQFAAPIMDSFLVGTEAFSILENISILGFPVPQRLIRLMRVYYEKK